MNERCDICRIRPGEGIVPSKEDFPEPLFACGECAETHPFVEQDGFPIAHFKAESGHWYFIYIHHDYLTPYFYPSARPDIKFLGKDVAYKKGVERKDRPLCRRIFPYHYDRSAGEDILYFAYGSDLDERLLEDLGVKFKIIDSATAFETVLDFSRAGGDSPGKGTANLRRGAEHDYAMGLLYLLAGEEEMQKLDRWDVIAGRHSQCRRILVHLKSGQPVPALTYVWADIREGLVPSQQYLSQLVESYRRHDFPAEWITRVECSARSTDCKSLAIMEPNGEPPAQY
jgi:hypothetical protein